MSIQSIFFIISIIIRHFEKTSDNIIQILNDFIYLLACASLFRYNSETNWSNGYITAFFTTITVNGLVVTLIQTFMLFKELLHIFCKSRKSKVTRISTNDFANSPNLVQKIEVRPETNVVILYSFS